MIGFFHKLYKGTKNDFFTLLQKDLEEENRRFIVTANAETFMLGKSDAEFEKLLLSSDTFLVSDGISIVKGAKKLGFSVSERVPGIEITKKLLSLGNDLGKTACFLGAKKEVLDRFCDRVKSEFPQLTILKAENGYTENKEDFFRAIQNKKPDIILVALGIPQQEKLIYQNLSSFDKGIFVGVGGSFDILSDAKKRAPDFFIRYNLEWLYRIGKEPKRIRRFIKHNLRFLLTIHKEYKNS